MMEKKNKDSQGLDDRLAEEHADWISEFTKYIYKQGFKHGFKHGREQ